MKKPPPIHKLILRLAIQLVVSLVFLSILIGVLPALLISTASAIYVGLFVAWRYSRFSKDYEKHWTQAIGDDVWPKVTLNTNELRPGDIIGTASNTRSSELIRACTGNGPISHVALYVGNNVVVESVQPRGRRRLANLFVTTSNINNVVVLRLRGPTPPLEVSSAAVDKLLAEAVLSHQSLYSLLKALAFRFAAVRRFAASDALICSELVVRAYKAAGIDFVKLCGTTAISPNTLYGCRELENVTQRCVHALIPNRESFIETVGISYSEFQIRSPHLWITIREWISAILYATSIERLVLKTPTDAWKWRHFWPYYFSRRAGELRLRWITRRDTIRLSGGRELVRNVSMLEIERNVRRCENFVSVTRLKIAVVESLQLRHATCGGSALWRSLLEAHYSRVMKDLNLRCEIWSRFGAINHEVLQSNHSRA